MNGKVTADLDHGGGNARVLGISLYPLRDSLPNSGEIQPPEILLKNADVVGR